MTEEELPPPVRRPLHGYEYSPVQQAEKEAKLRQLALEWPEVNPVWREWIYDFCAQTPEAELDHMVESGEFD